MAKLLRDYSLLTSKMQFVLAGSGLYFARIVFDSDAVGKYCSHWLSLPAHFSNQCCTCLLTCPLKFKNYLRTITHNYVLVHLDLCLICTLSWQCCLLNLLRLDIIPFQQRITGRPKLDIIHSELFLQSGATCSHFSLVSSWLEAKSHLLFWNVRHNMCQIGNALVSICATII